MLTKNILLREYDIDVRKPLSNIEYFQFTKKVRSVEDLLDIEEALNNYYQNNEKDIRFIILMASSYNGYVYPETDTDFYEEYDTYYIERSFNGKVYQYDCVNFNEKIDKNLRRNIMRDMERRHFPLDGFLVGKCIANNIDYKAGATAAVMTIESYDKDENRLAKNEYSHPDCSNGGLVRSISFDKKGLEKSNVKFEKLIEDGVNVVRLDAEATSGQNSFTNTEVISEKKSFYTEQQNIKRDEEGNVSEILIRGERKSTKEEYFVERGKITIKEYEKEIRIGKNIKSINMSDNPSLEMVEKQIVVINKELNKIILKYRREMPDLKKEIYDAMIISISVKVIAGKVCGISYRKTHKNENEEMCVKEISVSTGSLLGLFGDNLETNLQTCSFIKKTFDYILDIQLPAQGYVKDATYNDLIMKDALMEISSILQKAERYHAGKYLSLEQHGLVIGSDKTNVVTIYNKKDLFVCEIPRDVFLGAGQVEEKILTESSIQKIKDPDFLEKIYRIEMRENENRPKRVSDVIEVIALNKKTSPEILKEISEKRMANVLYVDENCAKALILNPSTPREVLTNIINSENHLNSMKDELAVGLMMTTRNDMTKEEGQELYYGILQKM